LMSFPAILILSSSARLTFMGYSRSPILILIESSSILPVACIIYLSERCTCLSPECIRPLFSSTPEHFRLPGVNCLQVYLFSVDYENRQSVRPWPLRRP